MSLKEMRKASGLTRNEISDATGINIRTLEGYEHGKDINGAKLKTLLLLCKTLNCRLEDLVDDEELIALIKEYAGEEIKQRKFEVVSMTASLRKNKMEDVENGKYFSNVNDCYGIFDTLEEAMNEYKKHKREVYSDNHYIYVTDIAIDTYEADEDGEPIGAIDTIQSTIPPRDI